MHKTWQNTIGGYVCSRNQPIKTLLLRNSCMLSDKGTLRAQNTSPMCEQHMILGLQHVATTCPYVMTPRVREPLVRP